MAVERDLALAQRQGLAGGDAELPFDEIDPGHHLGNWMFDLKSGVHLHEIKRIVFCDKLDRAGADIAGRTRRRDRRLADIHPARIIGPWVEPRRRRLLDDLLVAALDRAVALEEMHEIAAGVAEHLYLDMARRREIALDQHAVVAKGASRLAPGALERAREFANAATIRMPRPPPPAEALIITGKPIRSASTRSRSKSCSAP